MIKYLKTIFVIFLLYSGHLLSAGCLNCGQNGTTVELKKCSSCLHASYCSPECQRAHWQGHKLACRAKQLEKTLATQPINRNEKARLRLTLRHAANNRPTLEKLTDSVHYKSEYLRAKELCGNRKWQEALFIAMDAIDHHEKFDDQLAGMFANLIARINQFLIDRDPSKMSLWHKNVATFFEMAAKFGNQDAQAKLALYSNASECEFSPDDEVIKVELEKYAQNPVVGLSIRVRLAFEYYLYSNLGKAQKIFDELMAQVDEVLQVIGHVGHLKRLTLLNADKPVIDEAIAKVKSFRCLSDAPSQTRYDFVVILSNFADQDDPLIDELLIDLVRSLYLPAKYFAEELLDRRNEAQELKKQKIQQEILTDEALMKSFTDKKQELNELIQKLLLNEQCEHKTSTSSHIVPAQTPVLARTHAVLSPQAVRDLQDIADKFHDFMPFDDDAIEKIAQEIIASKGHCRAKLASKIRGTKTFWRSWLGRDYRIDWRYTQQNGYPQIEIRHIGLKKNFTYRF